MFFSFGTRFSCLTVWLQFFVVVVVVLFWQHKQGCSGLITDSVHRDHRWGWAGQSCSRQEHYLLYYHSDPLAHVFFHQPLANYWKRQGTENSPGFSGSLADLVGFRAMPADSGRPGGQMEARSHTCLHRFSTLFLPGL